MTDFNVTESAARSLASDLAAALLRETEAWAEAQCRLLSQAGPLWADWLQRRCEAIDAANRSVREMYTCRSLTDWAQSQQRWLAGAVERSAADARAVANFTALLTRPTAETAPQAGDAGRRRPVMRETSTMRDGGEAAQHQRVAAE